MLIYEQMPNGSLDSLIFGLPCGYILTKLLPESRHKSSSQGRNLFATSTPLSNARPIDYH
ncbi:hypothetical protein ACSBR2_000801 [Camellia fascicularis]